MRSRTPRRRPKRRIAYIPQRLILPDPVEVAADRELREEIINQIQLLPYREREIVCLLYGLGGPACTAAEIASSFGVHRNRITQIARGAIRALQVYSRLSGRLRTLMTDRWGERSLADRVAERKAREARAAQYRAAVAEAARATANEQAFMARLAVLNRPPATGSTKTKSK